MRNNLAVTPWSDINRMWNLMDGFWPSRDMDLVNEGFPIDMYQEGRQIIVKASTPGVRPEDLKVSMENGVLTISGETRQPFQESKEGRAYHREHTYGKFMRSIRLPTDVNEEGIEANLEHGVLTVAVPLTEPQKPPTRQIPIKVSESRSGPVGANAYADRPETQGGKTPVDHRHPVKN